MLPWTVVKYCGDEEEDRIKKRTPVLVNVNALLLILIVLGSTMDLDRLFTSQCKGKVLFFKSSLIWNKNSSCRVS